MHPYALLVSSLTTVFTNTIYNKKKQKHRLSVSVLLQYVHYWFLVFSTCKHALHTPIPPPPDEPVWAIGTGLVCPPSVAQEVHQFVRGLIEKKYGAAVASKTIIQYGGSVKPDNVKELMACPDIDGCLVGGASLTPDSFAKIVKFKDQK